MKRLTRCRLKIVIAVLMMLVIEPVWKKLIDAAPAQNLGLFVFLFEKLNWEGEPVFASSNGIDCYPIKDNANQTRGVKPKSAYITIGECAEFFSGEKCDGEGPFVLPGSCCPAGYYAQFWNASATVADAWIDFEKIPDFKSVKPCGTP